jgi:O-antigen/teichoic acid export membrane protein
VTRSPSSNTGISERRQRPRARAVSAIVDQGLSSISNVALTIFVARASTPREFGGYSVAFGAYVVALQISRAIASEPLLIRFSAVSRESARVAAGSGAGATLLFGSVFTSFMVIAGVVIGPPIEAPMILFGVGLPLLLLQDFWRYTLFSYGIARSAALNDAMWLGIQLVGFAALSLTAPDGAAVLAVWLAGGATCSIVGGLQAGVRPRLAAVPEWFRAHSDLIPRYSAEIILQRAAVQLTLYVVAGIVGLTAIGGLRGAQTLVGPMSTLYVGALLAAIPEMARMQRAGRPGLFRLAVYVSTILAALAIVWAGVLLLMPTSAGHAILGRTWPSAQSVILPFSLYVFAEAILVGPWAGLRALGAARQSLRARGIVALATAVLGCAGAGLFGQGGAAWGIALASVTAAGVWWFQFSAALASNPSRST